MMRGMQLLNRPRRKGARLGVFVALLAIVPGLVAGTAYLSGGSGGKLAGTPSLGSEWCGWVKSTNVLDSAYLGSITTGSEIGTGSPAIWGSVTFAPVALPTGATGYEYLDGEFDLACTGTPSTGTLTVSVDLSTNVAWTGAVSQSSLFFEQITGTATQPDFNYCTPDAAATHQPTAADAPWNTGACTGSSITDPTCASLFLPNDGDTTAANWWAYSMTNAATQSCNGVASMSQVSTITVANSIASSSDEFYGVFSIGIYASAASAASGTFTLTTVTS